MKLRLLDLCCGAGGASKGYADAGFEVVGVDIKPQPRYPFAFMQMDAIEAIRRHGAEFDVIHASPPCPFYSQITPKNKRHNHPDLIEPVRMELLKLGRPYVIENVVGAPLVSPITLCGARFGLKVYRHRLFESSVALLEPVHVSHRDNTPRAGHGISSKGFISITRGGAGIGKGGLAYQRMAMGIDWMNALELKDAIPPAYTEYIGAQLLAALLGVPLVLSATSQLPLAL